MFFFFFFSYTVMISEAGLNPQSPCLSLPSEGITSTQHHCSPFPYLVFFLLMVWVVLRPCHLDALAVLVNFLFPVLSPGHLCSLSLVTETHLHQEQSKVSSGGKACMLRIGGPVVAGRGWPEFRASCISPSSNQRPGFLRVWFFFNW